MHIYIYIYIYDFVFWADRLSLDEFGTAKWLLKQEQEGWELGIDLIIVVCYWLISCQ